MTKKKRGWNLKRGQFSGDYGRMRAHEIKGMKEVRKKYGLGTTKYKTRAPYGSRKNIRKYKPRDK